MAWGGASKNNEEEEEEWGAVFKRQVFVLEGLGHKKGIRGEKMCRATDKEGEKLNQVERLGHNKWLKALSCQV